MIFLEVVGTSRRTFVVNTVALESMSSKMPQQYIRGVLELSDGRCESSTPKPKAWLNIQVAPPPNAGDVSPSDIAAATDACASAPCASASRGTASERTTTKETAVR